jgi:hypothetical protein
MHAWLAAAGAVKSTEIADDGLHAACMASRRASRRLHARTHAHTHLQTNKHTNTGSLARARIHTRKHTRTRTRAHTPGVPGDDTVCFPHTLSTPHLSLALPAHALAYTPKHTHARATAHTLNAHIDGGLHRRMDARTKRRRGARGARCSRPSPIPSLHLFLIGGPPVTAGSLSCPPDHLDAPLRLTPSLACRSTILCTPAQGRCAAREPQESARRMLACGLAHLHRDTEPRSMCCMQACMHHPRRRYLPWMAVNGRRPGWMDGWMPVAARRLDALASLETGQDTTRRLGGRRKRWTMA